MEVSRRRKLSRRFGEASANSRSPVLSASSGCRVVAGRTYSGSLSMPVPVSGCREAAVCRRHLGVETAPSFGAPAAFRHGSDGGAVRAVCRKTAASSPPRRLRTVLRRRSAARRAFLAVHRWIDEHRGRRCCGRPRVGPAGRKLIVVAGALPEMVVRVDDPELQARAPPHVTLATQADRPAITLSHWGVRGLVPVFRTKRFWLPYVETWAASPSTLVGKADQVWRCRRPHHLSNNNTTCQ